MSLVVVNHVQMRLCCLLLVFGAAGAVTLQQQHLRAGSKVSTSLTPESNSNKKDDTKAISFGNTSQSQQLTFPQYVDGVTNGRGIWKWSNALVAYERHFGRFKNQPVKLGEVGVWSGGSLLMWRAVLGAQCHVYGFDLVSAAKKFEDQSTTITVLDQGDPAAWANFFHKVTPTLNVLVDDGGHQAHQMLTTTAQVWPHLSPGGILAIEDILGAHYLKDFFKPVAGFYGGVVHATLASLHIYPLVLIAEKASPGSPPVDPTTFPGAVVSARVTTLHELTTVLQSAPPGSMVELQNPAWDNFLTTGALTNFFDYFNGLHAPAQMQDEPQGCSQTSEPKCTYTCVNSEQQDKISGVHILPSKLVVEVAVSKPVIQAVRHGTEWIQYSMSANVSKMQVSDT